ncbi:hypothetical protein OPT61_g2426 [Boeremia exigua]|uniref:Uncharacterized protein n=1 Tax=Boeremia exigua TaxID=749465 RepID=A0ACC2ILI9_9PLEO|nr:hypothetical protein OPT61_g2426 [Boeremia exigua]
MLRRNSTMTSHKVQFEFVVSDPVSNPKPGRNSQIRSRCMQGRNKREDSRRTQREKRRIAKEAAARIVEPGEAQQVSTFRSPKLSLNNFAPIRFEGRGIDSEAEVLLFKVLGYNFFAKDVTPLHRCVTLDCLESPSFLWLFADKIFLHSLLCANYVMKDFQRDGKPGVQTMFHLRETLSLLRTRMRNSNAYQDEAVLRVIMNLTLLAIVSGDWIAAAAHLEGLRKIVHLRGFARFLDARPILHFKLDRTDLAWYLSSGQRPYFVQSIKSWDCKIAAPYLQIPSDLYQPSAAWDYRILNVFRDLQNLALRINRNKLKFAIHNPAVFQGDLTSVQSRLMCLADIVTSPIEQLVLLIMLAILTSTFRIPGRRVPYDWVMEQIRLSYTNIGDELEQDKSLALWSLFIVSLTVARPHDSWIRNALLIATEGLEWADVEKHLSRLIWIKIVHNKPGEIMFNQLRKHT